MTEPTKRINTFIWAAAMAVLVSALTLSPARAAGELHCSGIEGADAFFLVSQGMPVASIVDARLEVGGEIWATRNNVFTTDTGKQVTPIKIGQAFDGNGSLQIDFMDVEFADVTAKLHVVQHTDWDNGIFAQAGFLTVVGRGVYPVSCVS